MRDTGVIHKPQVTGGEPVNTKGPHSLALITVLGNVLLPYREGLKNL